MNLKNLFLLVAALIVVLTMTLIAGCGGGSDNSSNNAITTNYGITLYATDTDTNTNQLVTVGYDGTGWSAYPGVIGFAINLAGTKGMSMPSADFQIWKSSLSQNYNSPVDDEKSFNQKVADIKPADVPDYDFYDAGRYEIKACAPGTNTLIVRTFITINPYVSYGN